MSDLALNAAHEAEALAGLIEQYKDKPRLASFIKALTNRVQVLEQTLYDIFLQSAISAASGNQLDDIGEIVGQERQGMTDDEYRTFVRARIKTNRSSGKMHELEEILGLILSAQTVPPSDPIISRELYPASLILESFEVTSNAMVIWHDFLIRAASAGVKVGFIFNSEIFNASLVGDDAGGTFVVDGQTASDSQGSFDGGLTSCVFG